jgi:hypothetical protein
VHFRLRSKEATGRRTAAETSMLPALLVGVTSQRTPAAACAPTPAFASTICARTAASARARISA